MTAGGDLEFTLSWDDIDASTLPEDSRQPGSEAFRKAVTLFLKQQYEALGGKGTIIFDETARTLRVHWAKQPNLQTIQDKVQESLRRGDVSAAIPLLKALIAAEPDNPTPLYNLGLVYSDQGKLERAKALLEHAAILDPGNAHIIVAIGVAHARGEEEANAIETLERAIDIAPDDPFAHQNLGACLLKQGDAEKAERHFRISLRSEPDNLRSRYGLAQSLETLGRLQDADGVYQEIIKLAGHTAVGEFAKEGRTRIASALMRKTSNERPDVLMYCLGALEQFSDMTREQVQAVGREIAILGMRGLDINDPSKRYTLKSLQGDFSGLHLVSIMYVAFQKTSPDTDIGIDLSREYAQALEIFGSG
jgi:tetratricopeptide (TPR) repeat protein